MKPKHKHKKHFRRYKPLYVAMIAQVLIIFFFCLLWKASTPSTHVLKNAVIDVDDVKYVSWTKGSFVIVHSDDEEYVFYNLGYHSKYPNSKLAQAIEVGDELNITYFTQERLFGSRNVILDAYSQTNVFRTIDEYTQSKEGNGIWVIVLFVLIESIYLPAAIIYLKCCNLFKTKKKHRRRDKGDGFHH